MLWKKNLLPKIACLRRPIVFWNSAERIPFWWKNMYYKTVFTNFFSPLKSLSKLILQILFQIHFQITTNMNQNTFTICYLEIILEIKLHWRWSARNDSFFASQPRFVDDDQRDWILIEEALLSEMSTYIGCNRNVLTSYIWNVKNKASCHISFYRIARSDRNFSIQNAIAEKYHTCFCLPRQWNACIRNIHKWNVLTSL